MLSKSQFNAMWAELYKAQNVFNKATSDRMAGIVKKYLYPAGKVRIVTGNISVEENSSIAKILVERFEGNSGAVSVSFKTSDLTASGGKDYIAASGTLNWLDGEVGTKEINITIIDDNVYENNEVKDFAVSILNPTNNLILSTPNSATISIRDNDVVIPQPSKDLLIKENLEFVGSFRVPGYYDNLDGFSYGGQCLALNKANNSLFITGMGGSIAEISIPELKIESNIESLNRATMLKGWYTVKDKLQNNIENAWDGAPLGGLMVSGSRLVGTQYAYYSGAQSQKLSHFYLDSLDLNTAKTFGLYQISELYPRWTCMYMCEIPPEWQEALGGTHLTGANSMPIISTTSSGPCVLTFDPNDLTKQANLLLGYPADNPLGPYGGPANLIQGGTTGSSGVVFVPGTSTLLFFGATGTNYHAYGTPQAWGDKNSDGGTGPHSLNGEYAFQVWAYDVNELVKVKNGLKLPYEVRPYNVWNFDFPIATGFKRTGGVAYDKETGTIYISVVMVDRIEPYSNLPIIHVLKLNKAATNPNPEIGSMCVTPIDLVPGPIKLGNTVDFAATNVYAKPGSQIQHVEFFLDGAVLGLGTIYPTNNYRFTYNTSNLTVGTHIVKAIARDNNGLIFTKSITFEIIP